MAWPAQELSAHDSVTQEVAAQELATQAEELAGPWIHRWIDLWLELWGEGFARLAPGDEPTLVGMLVVGAVLLVIGRKAFWLALAALGFLLGWQAATLWFGASLPGPVWFVGSVGGVIGILLAAIAKRVAAALAGFALGGLLGAKILPFTPLLGSAWGLALPLVVGLVGAVLGMRLLEFALRIITSGVGAALLVATTPLDSTAELVLFVVLWLLGIALQRRRR